MVKAEIYDMIVKKVMEDFYNLSKEESNLYRLVCDKCQYSKKRISKAGRVLASEKITLDEGKDAMKVLNGWRAVHAKPLELLTSELRCSISGAIIVQRLKRLDSILGKLKRFPDMDLYRMQDLGGCRVIVDSIDQLYETVEHFKSEDKLCTLKREYDYVQRPKSSGYRSYHLVYKFDDEGANGILLEVQFRTKLEHVWATAIEVMEIYTKSSLKSSMGDKDLLRFFVLMSSIIALREGTPTVPETSSEYSELVKEIRLLNDKMCVLTKLRAISSAITKVNEKKIVYGELGYYVLRLDYEERLLTIYYFRKSELDAAIETYNEFEAVGRSGSDTVLIAAESLDTVCAAYPNYFVDIKEFLSIVEEVVASSVQAMLFSAVAKVRADTSIKGVATVGEIDGILGAYEFDCELKWYEE